MARLEVWVEMGVAWSWTGDDPGERQLECHPEEFQILGG